MAGIVQITQGGPRTFTPAVGVTVKGGQFVEQRNDGRIQPAGAASIRTVGVALTDGMAPEDVNTAATLNAFGRPVIVAVPVPTAVAVAYDATEVYVTASAAVLPGQRVICAANGQVTPAAAGPAADQVVGICTDPAGIAAAAIGRVRITL